MKYMLERIASLWWGRQLRRRWSCGVSVFVDEAVASGGSDRRDGRRRGARRVGGGCRRSLLEGAVWPVLVVARYEVVE